MSKQLKIVVNIGKGSPLTGNAWADVLLGGEKVIERAEVTSAFNSDPTQVISDKLEINHEYDELTNLTLTVINNPESIGPIQTYAVEFYLDGEQLTLNWQQAIKGKPLRFGGQPNVTITNPHIDSTEFNGWCSVPDISPGMSITWGLSDLTTVH
jgi:hypothetical protein